MCFLLRNFAYSAYRSFNIFRDPFIGCFEHENKMLQSAFWWIFLRLDSRAVLWIRILRDPQLLGSLDPDPGGKKLTKINKQTWYPTWYPAFCTYVGTDTCMFLTYCLLYEKFPVKNSKFLQDPDPYPHWSALVRLPGSDPDRHWDKKKLDLDPHWNQCRSKIIRVSWQTVNYKTRQLGQNCFYQNILA